MTNFTVGTDSSMSRTGHRPRASWWERLFGTPEPQFVTPPPSPPPVLEVVTLRREIREPFTVPALGDAFDFQIHPVMTWSAKEMAFDELRHLVDRWTPWACGVVREVAAIPARGFAPHRAYDLERLLNAQFEGQSWPRGAEGSAPRFVAQVRVAPDPRVRERLRPYWEERIRLECDHELDKLRSDQADRMTRRWREVLANLEHDPVTSHAARLTGERFAQVFGEFVSERKRAVPDLIELLEMALKGHSDLQMGPSEYTEAWDLALQTYRQQHGLADDGASGGV
ncbi:hypothetical protein [Plantactinospora sp. B5E13]|uniref:hypothetical protein n=1 Tax=Plantactinospora sp. B5E13 TaxID=3153758 RepID=UPI00325CB323